MNQPHSVEQSAPAAPSAAPPAAPPAAPSDHRRLGRELGLFDSSELIGAGLPLWLPDGAIVRAELERFAEEVARASGCRRVYTPVMARRELFERSGHWEKFSEDMFPPMRVGGGELVLRPANCPSHTQVFAQRGRSWRELPLRLSEVGSMFRNELTGTLGGLSRVRQINLDDAHVFCTPAQVVDEVALALRAIVSCYEVLGIGIDHFRLSLRGPGGKYAGDDAAWELSESALRAALEAEGLRYREAPGEAAFYGPKVDVQVRDAGDREETLSTVQVDRVMPERFGLNYVGEDGAKHVPVMVHRGLLSSMERMVALLVERYDGRLPLWLAPRQVRVLPVSGDAQGQAALEVVRALEDAGLRAQYDDAGTLGARIRRSREERVGIVCVVGEREVASGTVAVGRVQVPVAALVESLRGAVGRRSAQPPVFG